jgi:hypothetical protein
MSGKEIFESGRKAGKSKSKVMLEVFDVVGEVGKVRDIFVSGGVVVSYNFCYNVISKSRKLEKKNKSW